MIAQHHFAPGDQWDRDLYARERVLNSAIIAADISRGWEEYPEIFDAFYADDVEVTGDTETGPIRGRERIRALLFNCVLTAINRLIVAEEDVPVERRYSFSSWDFYSGGEGPALEFGSWERSISRAGPPRSRYCLSHFPLPRATPKPIGPSWARKSSCAGARFVSRIPSSVTVADANKLMMNTMIGSGFAAVSAADAERRLPSCRHSRRLTAITA